MAAPLAAALVAALLGATPGALAQPGPLVSADGVLGAGWREAGLPQQRPPMTRFIAGTVDGRAAVRVQAEASYGHLVFDLPGQRAAPRLRWGWRLEHANGAVDLASKAGDDAAAKVCLAFDLPLARVPFIERQLLRLARSKTGENLPAATLCWVWGHAEPRDALIANPYSRRVRVIVLRNRDDALDRWWDEERDIAADWRRAFGDESADVPPLLAVLVGADADNTGGRSVAHVAGLRFAP
ncbi:MAG: DUF3047 domain-containing protein [Rubrivivax sp.]|nr:DUF3047 domain-containing protein [Rubrivivax sp.]